MQEGGFFPAAAFGMQDFFLPNPLKFLWDGFLHRSFGGKKHELKLLGNLPLSLSLSLQIPVFFLCCIQTLN
jgi:hypothetical protein